MSIKEVIRDDRLLYDVSKGGAFVVTTESKGGSKKVETKVYCFAYEIIRKFYHVGGGRGHLVSYWCSTVV